MLLRKIIYVLLAKYYNAQIKDEMGSACNTHDRKNVLRVLVRKSEAKRERHALSRDTIILKYI
jgi:hypothetical protein